MPFCNKCGTEVPGEAGFCHYCGTPVGVTDGKRPPEAAPAGDDAFKTVVRRKPAYGVVTLEDLPVGHLIDDRYEVISKLGQGGFGAVYRVFDKKMKIDKALKVLPEAVTNDREAMESLGEEASTMVRLNQENIVRVFDFQEKGRIKYIDMEFVDGKSLTDVKLDSPDKKLGEAEVKKLAVQIATGLAYAHSKNVIHKDIKPQNILLSKTDKIKIMDFGISETVRSSMSRVENSTSSGTLVYMSPEQIKGMNVGREADLYSFGAMLYELLSGKTPFHKGAIEHQILNAKPLLIEGVSDEMNQFLQKCLAKDYKDRFRHFEAVLRALAGKSVGSNPEKKPFFVKENNIWKKPAVLLSFIILAVIIMVFALSGNNKKTPDITAAKQNKYTGGAESAEIIEEQKHVIRKARLHVNPTPTGATIKILNIKPAFSQGISLKPGSYHVSVSKKGYVTKKQWVEVFEDQTKNIDVRLKKKTNNKVTNSIGMAFVYIKPGSFNMGSNTDDLEKPVHRVRISKGFYMQTTEVTQGQWHDVMGSNPSKFAGCGSDCPVENVSWNDVKEFIRKLNTKEGTNKYRLPTEAEWEFVCSGGSDSDSANGNNGDVMGWYEKNSGHKTHSVGQKNANSWGLYDIHGNVGEWCEDFYGNYSNGFQTDPKGASSGKGRVIRGGYWGTFAGYLYSANRTWDLPDYRSNTVGFRLAGSEGLPRD